MATEIITLPELIDYMAGDPFAEGSVEDAIRIATNTFVESHCGREFGVDTTNREETKDIDNCYSNIIYVSKPPIAEFVKLEQGRTSWTLVDADSYVVDNTAGKIRKVCGYFIEGISKYRVTYKGGYSTLPADLKLATKSIAARAIQKVKKQRHGLRGVSFVQGTSEFFLDGLEKVEDMILEHYRINRF